MKQRIRIIPDLHGCDWWRDVVLDESLCDKIIFLGDYVDSYTLDDKSIIKNLLDIIEYKKSNPNKVELLFGNHCIAYFSKYLFNSCSGFRLSYAMEIHDIFNRNRELFNIITTIDTIKNIRFVFSHAGISRQWLQDIIHLIEPEKFEEIIKNDLDAKDLRNYTLDTMYEWINDSLDSQSRLNIVNRTSYIRGGSFPNGGPLWADMQETYDRWLRKDSERDLIQIVGHTPTKHQLALHKYDQKNNSSIHFCDLGGVEADILLLVEDNSIKLKVNGKEYNVI